MFHQTMAFQRSLSTIRPLACCVESLQRKIITTRCSTLSRELIRTDFTKLAQTEHRTFSIFSKTKSTCYKSHGCLSAVSSGLSEKKALIISARRGNSTSNSDDSEKTNARTDVLYDELRDLISKGNMLLVDVREPKEIEETGMMPGAINIPITKLKHSMAMDEQAFADTYKKQKPEGAGENIVFYGLSNIKSESALELSHKAGYKKARHYPGGWREWSEKQSGK